MKSSGTDQKGAWELSGAMSPNGEISQREELKCGSTSIWMKVCTLSLIK